MPPLNVSDYELRTLSLKQLTDEHPSEFAELVNRKACNDFSIGTYTHGAYVIEVLTSPILTYTKNGTPGYEFTARAYKNGLPVGFGTDGSIEIERFRVYGFSNFLVEDEDGPITKTMPYKESVDSEILYRNRTFREDLIHCIVEDVAHTIKEVGKDGNNIVAGKIGRTTDTFNPPRANGYGSTYIYYRADTDGSGGTFASWRASSVVANQFIEAQVFHTPYYDPPFLYNQMNQLSGNAWQWNVRTCLQFDTSSIPDANTISSATFSFNRNDAVATKADSLTTNLVLTAWNPANQTAWVKADQNTYSGTHLSSDLAWGSFAAAGTYTDMTLNSSGLTNISKTGYTFMMMRVHWDADNSNPGTTGVNNVICGYDKGDDTKPTKLVVVHAPSSVFSKNIFVRQAVKRAANY